jgi:hypothetical protein
MRYHPFFKAPVDRPELNVNVGGLPLQEGMVKIKILGAKVRCFCFGDRVPPRRGLLELIHAVAGHEAPHACGVTECMVSTNA